MAAETHIEKLLRLKQVLQNIPVSKTTWLNGVKSGKFPQPVKLGPRTHFWRLSDISRLSNGEKGER